VAKIISLPFIFPLLFIIYLYLFLFYLFIYLIYLLLLFLLLPLLLSFSCIFICFFYLFFISFVFPPQSHLAYVDFLFSFFDFAGTMAGNSPWIPDHPPWMPSPPLHHPLPFHHFFPAASHHHSNSNSHLTLKPCASSAMPSPIHKAITISCSPSQPANLQTNQFLHLRVLASSQVTNPLTIKNPITAIPNHTVPTSTKDPQNHHHHLKPPWQSPAHPCPAQDHHGHFITVTALTASLNHKFKPTAAHNPQPSQATLINQKPTRNHHLSIPNCKFPNHQTINPCLFPLIPHQFTHHRDLHSLSHLSARAGLSLAAATKRKEENETKKMKPPEGQNEQKRKNEKSPANHAPSCRALYRRYPVPVPPLCTPSSISISVHHTSANNRELLLSLSSRPRAPHAVPVFETTPSLSLKPHLLTSPPCPSLSPAIPTATQAHPQFSSPVLLSSLIPLAVVEFTQAASHCCP
jgi:hypothetical protein